MCGTHAHARAAEEARRAPPWERASCDVTDIYDVLVSGARCAHTLIRLMKGCGPGDLESVKGSSSTVSLECRTSELLLTCSVCVVCQVVLCRCWIQSVGWGEGGVLLCAGMLEFVGLF